MGGFSSSLCAGVLRNRGSDGRPLAFVSTNSPGAGSATYRVTVVRMDGDTICSRKYPYSPIPLSARDSTSDINGPIRYLTGRYPDQPPEVIRKAILDLPPYTTYPPLDRVLVGRDGTIWLESSSRRATPLVERTWTVLAPNGDPLGVVTVPSNVVIQDADRFNFWAVEASASAPTGPDPATGMPYRSRPAAVVRYSVVAGNGVP
jgi:hypothetical protein